MGVYGIVANRFLTFMHALLCDTCTLLIALFPGHSQILYHCCRENQWKAWYHHYVTDRKMVYVMWTQFYNDDNVST